MEEVNFCPFCDSPAHKLLVIKDDKFFCKECSNFFNLSIFKPKCPKCGWTKIENSDFPSPTGEPVFQCMKCMKMFAAKEFFAYNKI